LQSIALVQLRLAAPNLLMPVLKLSLNGDLLLLFRLFYFCIRWARLLLLSDNDYYTIYVLVTRLTAKYFKAVFVQHRTSYLSDAINRTSN